ncbi:hypothetical protein CENSYa_0218 [Cenarchaeum symbiosum A]|uniref:Uncharacterized protein n=1 Tax=Cenarchaeum symbiosum (strain A) TaxID=414004 RepID=A0RU44_CENSY|nr:hypothetical protein CENSYa_0218 [Cenarchaeum symbiosum A]
MWPDPEGLSLFMTWCNAPDEYKKSIKELSFTYAMHVGGEWNPSTGVMKVNPEIPDMAQADFMRDELIHATWTLWGANRHKEFQNGIQDMEPLTPHSASWKSSNHKVIWERVSQLVTDAISSGDKAGHGARIPLRLIDIELGFTDDDYKPEGRAQKWAEHGLSYAEHIYANMSYSVLMKIRTEKKPDKDDG